MLWPLGSGSPLLLPQVLLVFTDGLDDDAEKMKEASTSAWLQGGAGRVSRVGKAGGDQGPPSMVWHLMAPRFLQARLTCW